MGIIGMSFLTYDRKQWEFPSCSDDNFPLLVSRGM